MSSPRGASFNEGVPPSLLEQWRVVQTTARNFSDILARAGRSCIMAKSDMVAAYKGITKPKPCEPTKIFIFLAIPVCLAQRKLQGFKFLGALFLDLRLIFGDRAACMFFDRMHFCIIAFMVLPRAPLPEAARGRAIDDVPIAVPWSAAEAADNFVKEYRHQLTKLNIKAAPIDPLCLKAFDKSQQGEVLGVLFDTVAMTWSFSAQKTAVMVSLLQRISLEGATINLHQAEQLMGLVTNFSQLARPVFTFVDELIHCLRTMLAIFESIPTKDREEVEEEVPARLQDDCRLMTAIVQEAHRFALPILSASTPTPVTAIKIFTDVSGELKNNPSLGILVPQHGAHPPLVASLRLPDYFLISTDEGNHLTVHKTTLLESLSYLATLCIDPARWVGQELDYNVDNLASTLAVIRGRSKKDVWATTAVRAARVVAAGLGATIHTTWVRRCSSREATIADDLSHCRTAGLTGDELSAFLQQGHVRFPDPILRWMENPRPDPSLGVSCLQWIKTNNPHCRALLSGLTTPL